MSGSASLRRQLRQMLAALERERLALSTLDVDAMVLAGREKGMICNSLESAAPCAVDGECRGLLRAAKQQNEVNRKVRNLLAANVSARIEILAGTAGTYKLAANQRRKT